MKQHFSEADLLETYYTRPGQSMPVMMHLADCADCAARYERLERKIRGLRECPHEGKPETFWVRQRMSVMRKIDARRGRRGAAQRLAAAAAIVIAVSTAVLWDRAEEPAAVAAPVVVEESPWQSDELNEYSSMVAWESWVEDGDQS